ncbi:MAG: KH domain-containing protein [Oscillospiraceae bacterium]|nr:KH domain-containing protein [Oscillospiraceae bacterium]MCR5807287.1 KH domain-containing protein [Oscillospiraceae bacterium]
MTELLMIIAKGLVDDPDKVQVTRDDPDENGEVVYHLTVAPDDMGKVIGKQGKIARAIRTVMRAGAGRVGEKVRVEIDG